MARINEVGASRIAYPEKLGEDVYLHIKISNKDRLFINGVQMELPAEVYNVTFTK